MYVLLVKGVVTYRVLHVGIDVPLAEVLDYVQIVPPGGKM